jgi:hypothetical protein
MNNISIWFYSLLIDSADSHTEHANPSCRGYIVSMDFKQVEDGVVLEKLLNALKPLILNALKKSGYNIPEGS